MSAARDRAKLVLGVDDDASIREILGLALRSEGYSFVGVGSGEGCLKLLRQTRPNLVLLDVLLPGIDGYETCRRLRDQYPDLDVPLPIWLTPMTATCRVPPLSRVKLGIGWSRGVARDAEQ